VRGIKVIRTATAAAVAVAASLAVASPASALKVKYVAEVEVANPDSATEVDAFCPSDKWSVTGGGAFSNGGYELSKILDSYPIDGADPGAKPDDGWRALIWSTSSNFLNVEAQAICAKKLKLKNKRRVITPGTSVEGPTCSKGYRPTGGGIDTAGTFAFPLNVTSSKPFDGNDENQKAESWFANAEQGMGATTATTHVICARNKDVKLDYESEAQTVSGEDQGSAGVLCDEGEQVVGVGGDVNASGAALVTMFSTDSQDSDLTPDDGASVTVDNFNPLDILPEAYAVCAKDK